MDIYTNSVYNRDFIDDLEKIQHINPFAYWCLKKDIGTICHRWATECDDEILPGDLEELQWRSPFSYWNCKNKAKNILNKHRDPYFEMTSFDCGVDEHEIFQLVPEANDEFRKHTGVGRGDYVFVCHRNGDYLVLLITDHLGQVSRRYYFYGVEMVLDLCERFSGYLRRIGSRWETTDTDIS